MKREDWKKTDFDLGTVKQGSYSNFLLRIYLQINAHTLA